MPAPAASSSRRGEAPAGGYWERQGAVRSGLVCVWGREPAGGGPIRREVLPDGCVDVIWSAGRLMFAGPDTGPVAVAAAPDPVCGVRMRMWTIAPLLDVPLTEVVNRRLPIELALGRPGAVWAAALEASAERARPALLHRLVGGLIEDGPPPDPVAAAMGRSIVTRSGHLRLDRLAHELSYSERQLHRRFRAATGYSPKTFARIVRFQRAVKLLGRGARPAQEIARRCGYADASHLVREVRALGGSTPTALMSELSNPDRLRSPA